MQHQRTVQTAIFEAPRGEVTVDALMAMESAAWEHLRGEINLRRSSTPDRPLARCMICKSSVYIKAQATAAGRRAVRARGHFPSDEAATKLLYLILNRSEKEWKMPPREWSMAKAQFAVIFGERFIKAMAA